MKRTPLVRKTALQSKTTLRRSPMKRTRAKSTPARRAAKGMPCYIEAARVCNHDPETTVLAHFRFLGGGGTSFKPSDNCAAFGCSACNVWTDSPTPQQVKQCGGRVEYERDRNFYAARALARMRDFTERGVI